MRIGEAGCPHELVAGTRALRFFIRVMDRENRRHRARHPQLVHERIADQPRGIPRRPAHGQVPHRVTAHIELVGVDFTDLGRSVDDHSGCAEPLGAQIDTIGLDLQIDVAAHRLIRN